MYSLCFRRPMRPLERRAQQRQCCLVVDDDAVCRAQLQDQLRTLGLDTLGAGSLHEALLLVARHQPAMVLTDHHLPDGDGCALARRIRSDPQSGAIRLVGVSALAGKNHRRRCLRAGIDEVVGKPASLPGLAKALGLDVDAVNLSQASSAPGFAATLRALYRDSCLRDLAALQQAVRRHDRERALAYAHRIRGASQMMGNHAVAGVAAVLERVHADRRTDVLAQAHAVRLLGHLLSSPTTDGSGVRDAG